MNVACPECSTVYRIDPARVPGAAIGARCRVCAAVFRVAVDTPRDPGRVTTASAVEPTRPETSHADAADTAAEAAVAEAIAAAAPPAEEVEEPQEPEIAEPEVAEPSPAPAFGPQDPETRARRLARALVSDIKVYNPDKWEQSKAAGTLRKEFRDEILKSWEEYVEQVGDEMAKKTPFFRDALNDILSGGERVF